MTQPSILLLRRSVGVHAGLIILMTSGLASAASGQSDTAAVRRVVETVGAHIQAKDLAGLDTIYAHDGWVRIIEGAGVNKGWIDYRDNHLKPELAAIGTLRHFDVEPQVRGNVAWAAFRYALALHTPQGHVEIEGRGTAMLEKRGARWLIVHLHTSGRRKAGPR